LSLTDSLLKGLQNIVMPKHFQKNARARGMTVQEEIAALKARIDAESPAQGSIPHGKNSVVAFGSIPLSRSTLQGLESNAYTTMTSIQSGSIPHALAGRDILAAAKTGSGKTLSFLVPVLESLFRQGWSMHDGVGAIVLSPTRELAGQIFAVLRKIGSSHNFSAGLVIGGRNKNRRAEQNNDFQREQQSIASTNILVCTPGRLLQHLEQTPYFNVDSLQVLVLDEADRILDMGFREQLLRILDYLPTQRQTLLFSATQTKDVKHLATLSINRKTVEYVGVHDQDEVATPDQLKQSYVVVPIEHKLNCVYSFLKSHLKCKTIVFMASCSQVRHAWELFCQLRPGLSVLAMHGKLSQMKRMQVYDKFSNTPHSVMFATDVASRGLDFPDVDWVLQFDAPEDPDGYIHRVGRTARFRKQGQALLLLDPAEETCVKNWETKTPIQKKSINPTKTVLVTQRAASLVAEHASLHQLAKKAFVSYARSLALLPRKSWEKLDFREMNLQGYAVSLGLASMPSLEFLDKVTNREEKRETKNVNRKLQKLKEQIRLEKEKKKKKKRLLQETVTEDDPDSEEDDLLVVKARHEFPLPDDAVDDRNAFAEETIRQPKKIRIENRKSVKFGDDGTEESKLLHSKKHEDEEMVGTEELEKANSVYMDQVRQRLEQTKDLDKEEERERIRAKHKKKRLTEKAEKGEEQSQAPPTAVLHEGNDPDSEKEASCSSSEDYSSAGSVSSESRTDKDDSGNLDFASQEDIALALIRGQTL
jgi:ATP-dependent RNA helicase DDX10/DBP4